MMINIQLAASAILAVALSLLSITTANASSCHNPKIVQIKIAKGEYCWVYEGTATHFKGWFRKGQTLQVKMAGLAYFASPTSKDRPESWTGSIRPEDLVVEWRHRGVSAQGPNSTFISGGGENGTLNKVLPYSGTYEIGFSPCAMWHSFGRVVICAR